MGSSVSWSRRFYQNFCLCLLDFDWNFSLRSWSRRQMRLTCCSWVQQSQANTFYIHQPHPHQHHSIFITIITSLTSTTVILHPFIHRCLHPLSTGPRLISLHLQELIAQPDNLCCCSLGLCIDWFPYPDNKYSYVLIYRQVYDPEADAYNPQGRLWLGRKDHVQAHRLRQHNPQVSSGSPTKFKNNWSIQLV